MRRLIAYATAGAVAVSFWHLSWSRFGERGILVPIFVAGALYFFWRGWCGEGRGYLAIAGATIGLSIHTYTSNRFLPLVILIFILSEFAFMGWKNLRSRMSRWREYSWDTIYLLLPALVTAAPLIYYFQRHRMAGYRLGVVSVFSKGWTSVETWSNLVSNTWHVAGMFVFQGDLDPGRNMAGRPVWDYLLGILFTIGLVVALTRWRHAEHRLILISLGVMLLPTILSVGAPNQLRALGALPATCLLVAIGLHWTYEQVTQRVYAFPPYVYSLLTIVILTFSCIWTIYDYFGRWAPSESTYRAFQGKAIAIVDYIDYVNRHLTDVDIYVPLRLYNNYPQIIFLTQRDFPQRRSFLNLTPQKRAELEGRESIILLTKDRTNLGAFVCLTQGLSGEEGTTLFLPPIRNLDHDQLRKALEEIDTNPHLIQDRYGRSLATAYRIEQQDKPWQFPNAPIYATKANFAGQIELVGYDISDHSLRPGETTWLALYWHRIGQVRDNYLAFAQVIDSNWRAWGGGGNEGDKLSLLPWSLPTLFWPADEIVPDFYEIHVSRQTPPGKYNLYVGLYQGSTGERLTITEPADLPVDDMFNVATLKIDHGEVNVTAIQHPLTVRLSDRIELLGYDIEARSIAAGDSLSLTLYWQATGNIPTDYTVFTHLLGTDERIWGQRDAQSQGGRNPTSTWAIGEIVRDEISIPISAEAPCQDYELEIGMYDLLTQARLPVTLDDQYTSPEDRLLVEGIQIVSCNSD